MDSAAEDARIALTKNFEDAAILSDEFFKKGDVTTKLLNTMYANKELEKLTYFFATVVQYTNKIESESDEGIVRVDGHE